MCSCVHACVYICRHVLVDMCAHIHTFVHVCVCGCLLEEGLFCILHVSKHTVCLVLKLHGWPPVGCAVEFFVNISLDSMERGNLS